MIQVNQLYIQCQSTTPTKLFFITGVISITIVLSLLINSYSKSAHRVEKALEKANKELNEANRQIRSLLLNILPESIADRLTGGEKQIADYFDKASIMFCDLVGFTDFSSDKNAQEIVNTATISVGTANFSL